jgi:hypothetical protein
MFELMELAHPFDGKTVPAIIKKVREKKVKDLKIERSRELVALYTSLRNIVMHIY